LKSKDYLAEIAASLGQIARSLSTMAPDARDAQAALGTADAYHWDGDDGQLMAVPMSVACR
jgi:hypothetical protein